MKSTKSKLRVGSADDADIVIKQPTVSRYHCELIWKQGTWLLTDLDSTNGTFVDGVQISEPKRLSSSNVVTLGRGVAMEIPAPPMPLVRTTKADSREEHPDYKPSHSQVVQAPNFGLLYVLGTMAVMLLFGLVVWLALPRFRDQASSRVPDSRPNEVAEIEENKIAPTHGAVPTASQMQSGIASSSVKAQSEIARPAVEATQDMTQFDASTWAIIVESSDGKNQKLLGTAIAIGPNRLVTLASIVEAVEAVKSIFPRVLLLQPASQTKRLTPQKFDVHPNNKAALAKYAEFEKRLAEKIRSVKELKEPTLEESLEWSEQLESVMADIARTDQAVLTVNETLERFLPIAKDVDAVQANECVLRGFPMIVPSPDVQSNLPIFYLEVPATYRSDDRSKYPALLVESPSFNGIPMISMACLNQESELIGLCVREEPAQDLAAPKRTQISRLEVFWK